MKRRNLLRWLCQAIAVSCTAIVAFPAIQFVIAPLRKKKKAEATSQRVAQLGQLKTGEPQQFAIIGNRRDAWTVYPNAVVGRVWLVLRNQPKTPDHAKVDVYSSVCPHLRCDVQLASNKESFNCPCHNAEFSLDGEAISREKLGRENPTPRGMDTLVSTIVQDDKTKEWWIEVTYQKFKTGLTTKVKEA